ncbi:hypothetical protein BJV82DRAFT_353368 [Fennellomyces sp. T-0311]|nr:hypothetical protein BJV82DRAFT_353368 [Fennellomyces sp. T-0311]
MQVVTGSIVNDHYWTLSYSWNQSGEIIHRGDEEYERIDEGRHTIVSTREMMSGNPGKEVKFEGLIQQMCIDFGIQYIWYDQMCIDQGNHDEKVHEIQQMHLIYKNARCTLALIPELEFTGDKDRRGHYAANTNIIPNSQWSKRMWTLEETYMSKSILFVGCNVYLWSDHYKTQGVRKWDKFIENIQGRGKEKWEAGTVLWYARTRRSTKAHDQVFALANIFPELQEYISFSYHQSPIDLMIQFYGRLAEQDTSILRFGATIDIAILQKDTNLLPSWTGVDGIHIPQSHSQRKADEMTIRCIVTGDSMCLTSNFVVVRVEPTASIERSDPLDHPDLNYTPDGLPNTLMSCIRCITEDGSMNLTVATITSEAQYYHNLRLADYGLQATHFFPLKMKNQVAINALSKPTHYGGFLSITEECSECIVLSEVSWHAYKRQCYPVIKRDNDHYKSIGVFIVEEFFKLDAFVQPKQSFEIK